MRAIAVVAVAAVFLGGCANRPAQEFGFGQPPTVAQTRGIVQEHLDVALKDPSNIQGLTIGRPEAACYQRGPGKRDVCGYRVCVAYNAKNSFGGYVGRKVYAYWILKRWGLQIAENRGICPVTFEDWHGSPPIEPKEFCKFQPRNAGCLAGKTEQFAHSPESLAPPGGSASDYKISPDVLAASYTEIRRTTAPDEPAGIKVQGKLPASSTEGEGKPVPYTCDQVAELAHSVMKARQVEAPLQRVMAIGEDSELVKALAIMAYERPSFRAKENQDRAANEFQNFAYMTCLKGKK